MEKLQDHFLISDDGATAALDLYAYAKADLPKYLEKSSHSERLKKLNIEKDIAFCLQFDVLDSIPILENGKLVKLEYSKSPLVENK